RCPADSQLIRPRRAGRIRRGHRAKRTPDRSHFSQKAVDRTLGNRTWMTSVVRFIRCKSGYEMIGITRVRIDSTPLSYAPGILAATKFVFPVSAKACYLAPLSNGPAGAL